jgi:lipoate---protein ligase
MIFVDNQGINDPSINLALEEYLLRNILREEEILLFYINEPSIIIGRHQNTIEEINQEYVEAHHVHVVRRLSGGGAVYHDLGNLNFSFITPYHKDEFQNFKKFTEPVVRALQNMGIKAGLSGRNDILVDERKISGNAQYVTTQRMVSHGTLLFNSDLSRVGEALHVKASKISSKGIKSVRSRVANLTEFLDHPLDIMAFRSYLLTEIFSGSKEIPQYHLTEADWQSVHALTNERYRNWDWNYGKSPKFNVQKTNRFPFGEVEACIDVENGLIQSIKFFGDFFSEQEPSELEPLLLGVRYDRAAIQMVLSSVEVSNYFSGMTRDVLLDFLV